MGGEQTQRSLVVPGSQGGQKRAVLFGDAGQIVLAAAADSSQQEQVDLAPDSIPCRRQAPVSCRGEDFVVECDVEADQLVCVDDAFHPCGDFVEHGEAACVGMRDDSAHCEVFQGAAEAVELGDVLGRQSGDRGAAVPRAMDQTLAFKHPKRLADRAATDLHHT